MNKEAKEFSDFLKKETERARGGKRCPNCKGDGYVLRKEFIGVDCYDEPKYYTTLYPCTVCIELVRRVKRKYR